MEVIVCITKVTLFSFNYFCVMHRRICVHINILTTKKAPKLAVKWPRRTLYKRKWCTIFQKFRCLFVVYEVLFLHCSSIYLGIDRDHLTFYLNLYCIQILRELYIFKTLIEGKYTIDTSNSSNTVLLFLNS
jgi:hypothetical protein